MDTKIECWCKTCQGYVTVEEVRVEFHAGHEFSPEDIAALQAVRAYLRRLDEQGGKQAAKANDHSA